MEGLWLMIVTETGEEDRGAGVLYVRDGAFWGGDNGYYWQGVMALKDGGVRGSMNVVRYNRAAKPLFAAVTNPEFYVVEFDGGFHPDRFWVNCRVVDQPELKASVQLRRASGVPE